MNVRHLKKGLSLRIAGSPDRKLRELDPPRHVGMVPEQIPFVKPRLLVEEDDAVAVGTPLFEDKRNPRIRFLSPGGGRVTRIVFGRRRVIRQIFIGLEKDEPVETFDVPPVAHLNTTDRQSLVGILLAGGMWPFFRALPFMDLADPDAVPPAIIVRLGDNEPFGPDPVVYLDGRKDAFETGLAILDRLCDQVVIHLLGDRTLLDASAEKRAVRHFGGGYPTGNPAVQRYRTKTGPEQNRSWYIDGQDVILLGAFLRSGRYPVERIVSVGGSLAPQPGHVKTRAGVLLRHVCGGLPLITSSLRYIVGGMFTGFTGSADSFMGFYQNALNLIDDGDREEPFGFIRPGYDKPSYSRAFLSAFRRKPFAMDGSQHGEARACVNCGACAAICPVDILPQFTMKCLVVDEVEEALAHGLLDCAECGLCTYVCPSKIRLCQTFRSAKAQYYRESG